VKLALRDVYGDALKVYRLLMRRSILTAALVYAAVDGFDALARLPDSTAAQVGLGLVSFVLVFAGPVLVQGALVEIVRNVHEGRRPDDVSTLLRAAGRRFWSLFAAAILYAIGVIVGLALLILPGVIVATRWCLLAPLIMLEGRFVDEARLRSSQLVRGHTGGVAIVVVITFFLTTVIFWPIGLIDLSPVARYVIAVVLSSLTAPFSAHVLTVLYYRLTDPERPVIAEAVNRWDSVWAGPTAED
jgi:hypothetical protein